MNTKKIGLFLLLTFALSWLIALSIYLLKIDMTSVTAVILLVVYMYMPALSAFIVQKLIFKEDMIKPLKISFRINKYFGLALLIPALLIFLTTFIGILLPGVEYAPDMSGLYDRFKDAMTPEEMAQMQQKMNSLPFHPVWLSVIQGFIYGATINALAAFGEELGWRGFLLSEFRKLSFFKACLIIGIIWGIWHAPIILMGHNYPAHPEWGVLLMTVFCTLYTFLFIYITLKARSVIAAALMHGSVNAFAGIALMLSSGGSDLLTGMTGAAGLLALFITIVVLFIYDRWISKENIMRKSIGEVFGQ